MIEQSAMSNPTMAANEVSTDVVVIGGGAVGLTTSMQFSSLAPPLGPIKHIVLEKQPTTAIYPKAFGLNQRSMEVFRRCGVEEDIYHAAATKHNTSRVAWYTSIGEGTDQGGARYKHLQGREIFSKDAFGRGRLEDRYGRVSPTSNIACPQRTTEPILLRQARALAQGHSEIRFGAEVVNVVPAQSPGEAAAITLKDGSTIKAKYVIVADGGALVGNLLGVHYKGVKNVFNMVTAHFKAPDLYRRLKKLGNQSGFDASRNLITFLINPECKGTRESGILNSLGPYRKDLPQESDEFGDDWFWGLTLAYSPDDPAKFDKDTMLKRIRKALNLPHMPMEIDTITNWYVSSLLADSFIYPQGSLAPDIFFVGDAGHRIVPWGGWGLNIGIQDVPNLAWKLALALSSPEEFRSLLPSYDTERRSIAITAAKRSFANFEAHEKGIDYSVGIRLNKTPQENWEEVKVLLEDEGEEGQKKRRGLLDAIDFLEYEFSSHGFEAGQHYYNGAIAFHEDDDKISDPVAMAEEGESGLTLPTLVYWPRVAAGHFLPHAWVESKDQRKISTIDIVTAPRFALLASPRIVAAWKDAVASSSSPLSKHIDVYSISPFSPLNKVDADFNAMDDQWSSYNLGARAVLVRPDNIIGWVSQENEAIPREVLDKALEIIRAGGSK